LAAALPQQYQTACVNGYKPPAPEVFVSARSPLAGCAMSVGSAGHSRSLRRLPIGFASVLDQDDKHPRLFSLINIDQLAANRYASCALEGQRIMADLVINRAVTIIAKTALLVVFAGASLGTAFSHDAVDVDADVFPWSSVGKIYNSARSSCTGSVIAPDKVLTAAHCLFNRATGRFLQPDALHFLLGYKRGEFRAHARVASYVLGPNYKPDEVNKSILADWAILVLTESLSKNTTPFPLAKNPSVAGERIMVGGFSQRYPFKLTADTDCAVRGILPNSLIVHDCAVMHGVSGAPLLIGTGPDVQVVGVHVATGGPAESVAAFAVRVSSFAQQASSPSSSERGRN
jgi:protease YdgD